MRAVVRWLTRYVALLGLLALPSTGCGKETNNNDTADVTTTSPSVPTANPIAFLAEARVITFGTKDLAAASDVELLRLGKAVCDGLGTKGVSFRRSSRGWCSRMPARRLPKRRPLSGTRCATCAQHMPAPSQPDVGRLTAVTAACRPRPRPLLLGLSTYKRVCVFPPGYE